MQIGAAVLEISCR